MNTHEQLIQRMYDAIDRKSEGLFREIFATDARYERPRCPPMLGVEALITFYRDERPIASGKHLIEHIVANETCGAAWGRMRGVTKDGKDVDVTFSDVFELDTQGRISKRRSHFFDASF